MKLRLLVERGEPDTQAEGIVWYRKNYGLNGLYGRVRLQMLVPQNPGESSQWVDVPVEFMWDKDVKENTE